MNGKWRARGVEVEFEVAGKAVVDFEVRRVLADVGILRGLQSVEFVIDLEVQRALIGDVGVVGVEGHLRVERRGQERQNCR